MSEFDSKVLVEHIDTFGKNLSEWEINFIAKLIDDPIFLEAMANKDSKTYSPKVVKLINRIYDEKT